MAVALTTLRTTAASAITATPVPRPVATATLAPTPPTTTPAPPTPTASPRPQPASQVWSSFGEKGTAPGQFVNPDGIALDAQGNLYVADEDNHRIQKLTVSPGQP